MCTGWFITISILGFSQTVSVRASPMMSRDKGIRLIVVALVLEHVGKVALAAVLTVEVLGHEDTGTTVGMGALTTHASHLVGGIHLVVLEHMKFDLVLLGLGVGLLLTLLTTSTQAEHKVQGGLLLDVVVLESAAILELLAGEDEALLVRGDALLVLDLGLHGL